MLPFMSLNIFDCNAKYSDLSGSWSGVKLEFKFYHSGMITWESKHPCQWNWSTQRQDFSWLLKRPSNWELPIHWLPWSNSSLHAYWHIFTCLPDCHVLKESYIELATSEATELGGGCPQLRHCHRWRRAQRANLPSRRSRCAHLSHNNQFTFEDLKRFSTKIQFFTFEIFTQAKQLFIFWKHSRFLILHHLCILIIDAALISGCFCHIYLNFCECAVIWTGAGLS